MLKTVREAKHNSASQGVMCSTAWLPHVPAWGLPQCVGWALRQGQRDGALLMSYARAAMLTTVRPRAMVPRKYMSRF